MPMTIWWIRTHAHTHVPAFSSCLLDTSIRPIARSRISDVRMLRLKSDYITINIDRKARISSNYSRTIRKRMEQGDHIMRMNGNGTYIGRNVAGSRMLVGVNTKQFTADGI